MTNRPANTIKKQFEINRLLDELKAVGVRLAIESEGLSEADMAHVHALVGAIMVNTECLQDVVTRSNYGETSDALVSEARELLAKINEIFVEVA